VNQLIHLLERSLQNDRVRRLRSNDVTTSSEQLLRKLVSPETAFWCKPEYFVLRGDPAQQIIEFAKLREPDLVVLGARQEKGVFGAASHLPTATAHKVVSHAPCPVLTVRH
jgi:nucleotide-binding universal stress UspA family protein